MKVLKLTLITLALGVCIWGCSKSSSTTPATASIQGNWTFTGGLVMPYFDGTHLSPFDSTIKASSGDYANFTSTDSIYAQIGGIKDTSTYSLIGSNNISFKYLGALDTFAISTLTQNNCTLSYKTPTIDTTITGIGPGTAYAIITINLSR